MNFIKPQLFFLLVIPLYVNCMELSKTVTQQGKDYLFHKQISAQKEMKEIGRISTSQYSVANICMLMNIKALPFDIQHRIALLFLGNKINSCATFKLSQTFRGPSQLSPDETSILAHISDTNGENLRMSLLDMTSGDEITSIKGTSTTTTCLKVFSRDGTTVFLSSPVGKTGLWNTASGNCLWSLEGDCVANSVLSAAFSPDGKTVLTGSKDGTVLLLNSTTGEQLKGFRWHTRSVASVAFSSDGKAILTGSVNGRADVTDLLGNKIITLQGLERNFVKEFRVISNGISTILIISHDSIAHLWTCKMQENAKKLGSLPSEEVIMSPACKAIVTLSDDDDTTACLYDTITGEQLVSFKGHTEKIVSVVMCAEGNYIITGSNDHTARLWDAASGTELCIFKGHTGPVVSVALSSDGKTIITGSTDTTARVWDTLSGESLCTLNHEGPVASVAVSSNGKTIITGSFSQEGRRLHLTGYVWDATTGQQLKEFLYNTNWKRDLELKVIEKSINAMERLTGQAIPSVSTIAMSSNDTSALIKQRITLPEGSEIQISQLWNNGYSKDFMIWIATEIRPLQAWLILQLIQADDARKPFSMDQGSLEDKLLKSIPADFQNYLIKRYSIEINPEKISSECSLQ